jgi:hypothetical protein
LSVEDEYYEGTDRDDKYKLMWIDENNKKQSWKFAQERQIRFDGTNGQLFDSDHEPFAAFLRQEEEEDNTKQQDDPSTELDSSQQISGEPTENDAVKPEDNQSAGLDPLHQISGEPSEQQRPPKKMKTTMITP